MCFKLDVMKKLIQIFLSILLIGLIARDKHDNFFDTLSAGIGCIFKTILLVFVIIIIIILLS